MRVLRSRLLVTLVLTAIVSTVVSSGALAASRSFSRQTTITSVTGVSGFDRHATPTSGDPDAGGTGQPVTTRTLSPSTGGVQRTWWDWTSLWATVLARFGRF